MSLYELDYFAARVDERRSQMQRQELIRLHEQCGRWPSFVLDIGCGTGEFLDFFEGAKRYGIEESRYAQTICASRGVSFDLPDEDGWADLVIMRGVLQHFPNPHEMLAVAHRALRPGGLLAILATPNAESLVYRLHKTLPCLVPELNHWIPGTRSLTRVLAELGYKTPTFHFPYRGTPYARPWRDLALLALGRPAAFPGNILEAYARR